MLDVLQERPKMKPKSMSKIFGLWRYDTDKSELIASDAYHDGNNWERGGTNTFLFRTPTGRYLMQYLTTRPDETDFIQPLYLDDALTLWFELDKKYVEFEVAFPKVEIKDA